MIVITKIFSDFDKLCVDRFVAAWYNHYRIKKRYTEEVSAYDKIYKYVGSVISYQKRTENDRADFSRARRHNKFVSIYERSQPTKIFQKFSK